MKIGSQVRHIFADDIWFKGIVIGIDRGKNPNVTVQITEQLGLDDDELTGEIPSMEVGKIIIMRKEAFQVLNRKIYV